MRNLPTNVRACLSGMPEPQRTFTPASKTAFAGSTASPSETLVSESSSLPFPSPSPCASPCRVGDASLTRGPRVSSIEVSTTCSGAGISLGLSRLFMTWWRAKPGTTPYSRPPDAYLTTKPRAANASSTREKSTSSYGRMSVFSALGRHTKRPSRSQHVQSPAKARRNGSPLSLSASKRDSCLKNSGLTVRIRLISFSLPISAPARAIHGSRRPFAVSPWPCNPGPKRSVGP